MFTVNDAIAALSAAEAVVGSTLLNASERTTLLRDLSASIPTRCSHPDAAASVKAAIGRAVSETTNVRTTKAAPRSPEGVEDQAASRPAEGVQAEADRPPARAEAGEGPTEGVAEQAKGPRKLRGRRSGEPNGTAEAAA